MGSRKGTIDKFQPVRGIITEASDMNFPQDAAYDLENVEITKEGKTQRRLGLEQETGGSTLLNLFTETDRAEGVYSTFVWRLTAGSEETNLRIIQTGSKLRLIEDIAPLSSQTVLLDLDLSGAPYTTGNAISTPCQYAYGAGFIIIANENANTIVIRSVGSTVNPISLATDIVEHKIRTRTLLEPFDAGDNYSTILTVQEEFNLRNSGWPFLATVATDPTGSAVINQDPVANYLTNRGVYPSHSRVYSAMKLTAADNVAALGAFSALADQKVTFGNTIPPLGHYIHSAFSFDARSLLLTEGTPISTGTTSYSVANRPISCAYLNGHAIYGDIDESNKTRIMVSQSVKEISSLARCYQEADPTADEINDVIATDGFVIRPVGMGKPLVMRETSKGVVILCSNGVWVLRGASGSFSATDFEIVKLAQLKFSSPNSVIVVDDTVFFCAERGIFTVGANELGELRVANITDTTIKTLYLEYGTERIKNMIAAYVQEDNYIYWLVPEEPVNGNYKGDAYEMLVLNLELEGFFLYDFGKSDDRPALHIPMSLTGLVQTTNDEPVTLAGGGEGVFTLGGEAITVSRESSVLQRDNLVFFASHRQGGTLDNVIGTLTSTDMQDWTGLGAPQTFAYTSFIEFAYVPPPSFTGGVAAPYIHSFFEQGRKD